MKNLYFLLIISPSLTANPTTKLDHHGAKAAFSWNDESKENLDGLVKACLLPVLTVSLVTVVKSNRPPLVN